MSAQEETHIKDSTKEIPDPESPDASDKETVSERANQSIYTALHYCVTQLLALALYYSSPWALSCSNPYGNPCYLHIVSVFYRIPSKMPSTLVQLGP